MSSPHDSPEFPHPVYQELEAAFSQADQLFTEHNSFASSVHEFLIQQANCATVESSATYGIPLGNDLLMIRFDTPNIGPFEDILNGSVEPSVDEAQYTIEFISTDNNKPHVSALVLEEFGAVMPPLDITEAQVARLKITAQLLKLRNSKDNVSTTNINPDLQNSVLYPIGLLFGSDEHFSNSALVDKLRLSIYELMQQAEATVENRFEVAWLEDTEDEEFPPRSITITGEQSINLKTGKQIHPLDTYSEELRDVTHPEEQLTVQTVVSGDSVGFNSLDEVCIRYSRLYSGEWRIEIFERQSNDCVYDSAIHRDDEYEANLLNWWSDLLRAD